MNPFPHRISNGVNLDLGFPYLPIFKKAWDSLVYRSLNMFSLIGLGTGVAYLYSLAVTLFPHFFSLHAHEKGLPNLYYEELIATWELDPVYPTFVLLDGQGVIRYRATGKEGKDLFDGLDLIESLLQETAAKSK